MNEREAFLRGIAANLYDDAPRLAFADWLDERGEDARAEFIRVQIELEPIRDRYEIPRAAELHEREDKLLDAKKWLGKMPKGWDDRQTGASIEFRRGFPDTLALPVRSFLLFGCKIRNLHPTIRRVVLFRVHGHGKELAYCVAFCGLAELELACWYSDDDIKALAESPHLADLQVLVLWLGRQSDVGTDANLCKFAAKAKAWTHLRELTLLNPDGENAAVRKKLVARANKAAGREVAVYRRGYPELFPFAAEFWYTFPGYLPDGRMAMGAEDHRTNPPTLCVVTFDKRGKQTKDVIQVSVPDDVLKLPVGEWFQHKDRLKQQLIDVLGFRPAFIRVRDCEIPSYHSYFADRGHGEYWEERLGAPDIDDEEPQEEDVNGIGGHIYWLMYSGQWEFGDRWADNTGHVHTT